MMRLVSGAEAARLVFADDFFFFSSVAFRVSLARPAELRL